MPVDKWQAVDELFHAALELDPAARAEFLTNHCEDTAVREEVASLLAAHQNAGNFIETPVSALQDLLKDQTESPMPAENIGVYKIVKEIGRGGMGAVYLAHRADQAFEKHVAVKVLKPGMDTAEVLRHFQNERQILADFDHPNIARLLDGGTTQSGLPYFVLEYVAGMPVDDYCNHHRLSIYQRLELFRQICSAVSYAHRHLVIHRDLKPSNILVTAEGVPKLLDFGIAKILNPERQGASTATGINLMTPEYASPEQMLGLPVTTLSDVYSLGVLLYELLVGRLPYEFEGRSPLEIARVVHDTQPLLSSAAVDLIKGSSSDAISDARSTSTDQLKRHLRGDLDNILSMAIRKEPQRRYQSVEQFSEDIRRHLERLPVLARKDTIVYRFTKFTKRNPIAIAAIVLVFMTLLAGVVATTWQAQKARAEQERSEFAREFGDELRYIETLLLSTYTAPLHDARQNLHIAKNRLNEMEKRVKQNGETAYASGNNALGNGYLMLKDYERAKRHLEQAWNSGYRGPSIAYALGKVLGNLYQQTITNADQLSSNAVKQKAIHEAEVQYSRPAIRYLTQARTFAESPVYVEALVALYQNRFEEALRKASLALKTSSRPYEVIKLQGDIYFGMGRNFVQKGDVQSGLKSFGLAGTAYGRAAEVARSDPDIYLADVRRLTRTIAAQTGDAAELIDMAILACDKAIRINPDADAPYLAKSEIYIQQGTNEMYFAGKDPRRAFRSAAQQAVEALKRKETPDAHDSASRAYLRTGEYELSINVDPRKSLSNAVREADRAVKLDPYFAGAYSDEASAYFLLSEYQLNHGEDPTGLLKKVIEIHDTRLQSVPKDLYAYNLLALSYMTLGEYKLKQGMDPTADIEKSIKLYKDALKKSPSSLYLYEGLALAMVDIAKYQIETGVNPEETLKQAIESYNKSLEKNLSGFALFNRALAYLTRAEYSVRVVLNPEQDLAKADQDLRKALELTSELPSAVLQSAVVHLLRARFLFATGKNPETELIRTREILTKFNSVDPNNREAILVDGMMNLLFARWSVKQKLPPDPFFDSAAADFEKAIVNDPKDLAVYLQSASVYRFRAESRIHSGNQAEKWITLGLNRIIEAEKICPQNAEALALRSVLLKLRSRISYDPALANEATSLLQKALQNNPLLKSEYGS